MDKRLCKEHFGFNYWILSRLFSVDEEIIQNLITEYNDKAIDCYVHFPENKELFIIQNKYYDGASISRSDVADFLTTPLTVLEKNVYVKSSDLQNVFNQIRCDPDYKIHLFFFSTITDSQISQDIQLLIQNFNYKGTDLACLVDAAIFGLEKIYELYYGKSYKQNVQFTYPLATINKGTFASIREEYKIETLYEAYYIVTPVIAVYKLVQAAEEKGYALFEKNIREYLGNNAVNNGIVETLKNPQERKNFMYYNNGITIICQKIQPQPMDSPNKERIITLTNPQIVNGCQTVNSIKKVLENNSVQLAEKDFKNVFVMIKALVIENPEEAKNKTFYQNVVKYTNKQNAISEKAFVSNLDVFYRLQTEFKARGFLLHVKPSDKNMVSSNYNSKEQADFIQKARKHLAVLDIDIENISDISIPLEKLLQVFIAFEKGGYYAFTKKNLVLRQDNEIFMEYCSQIQNFISTDDMLNLYYLYKKAESDRSKSEDKRVPIPYYVIGFLGDLICVQDDSYMVQQKLKRVFYDTNHFSETYQYLIALSKNYRRMYANEYNSNGEGEYNVMIKRPIDMRMFNLSIEIVDDIKDWCLVKEWKNMK